MRILAIATLPSLLLATSVTASPSQSIVEATDYGSLSDKFCAADHSAEHIVVLPAAIYDSYQEIKCESGTYGLRSTEPEDDPGHKVYNVDPPHGVDNALDCDGKADVGMAFIALNCYPVSKETATHPKT